MKRRVLVVDDEPATNMLATEYLRLSGFEVAQCFDGPGALAVLEADPGFDLVILDKRMPGLDGVDVCRAIKKDPRTAAIPVLLLSASVHPAVAQADSGAAAFLPKPFSPKDLVAAVRKAIG